MEKQKKLSQEIAHLKSQLDKKTHEISDLQKSLASNKKTKDEEIKKAKLTISDLESKVKTLGEYIVDDQYLSSISHFIFYFHIILLSISRTEFSI